MNERIQQLADEAVTRIALRCEGSMESDKHGEWIRYDDLEKFAELIVRECAGIADIKRDTSAGCGYVTHTNGQRIKKHFGVEE